MSARGASAIARTDSSGTSAGTMVTAKPGTFLSEQGTVARKDQPSLCWNIDQAQPVGRRTQLELVVPQDLQADELDRECCE